MSEREWWEPVVTDEEWLAEKRADYPDECAGLDDDDVREKYADGLKYQTLWDNLGDAREEHEALADAYLALRAALAEAERENRAAGAEADVARLERLHAACDATIRELTIKAPAAVAAREEAERERDRAAIAGQEVGRG